MRRVLSRGLVLLAAGLTIVGACSSNDAGGPPLNNDPAGGRPGAPAPSTPGNAGSAGSGGAGGASGPSMGGSTDAASGPADAGAAPGQPPAVNPPPAPPPPPRPSDPTTCAVSVSPLSPQRFSDIPAGEGYRLRVGGRASGVRVPASPTWRWVITHESNLAVPHKVVEGDPAVIEFPTEMTGRYTILAEILGTGEPCQDQKTAFAVVPNRLIAKFRVRATPPAGRMLALFEADVLVSAGMPVTKTIDLQRGYEVLIDPQDEQGFALSAFYVRVSGRSSTARFDGYVSSRSHGFKALLELGQRYDVLLVPDGESGPATRAPLAYSGLLAEEFGLQSFEVRPGVRLAGAVRSADGALEGARVRLRAGALPSTVGQADAAGVYELRVRGGRFEVRVVPPESSGLPEAQLPESTGLAIADAPADLRLDFTYAPASNVRLSLGVQGPAGGTLAGVRVQLESEPGALPDVGGFSLGGGARIPAAGIVRRVRTTDASGVATFEALPRARYRAVLVPPDEAPEDPAITLAELDMAAVEGAVNTRTVVLGRRSRLTGRLSPQGMAAGLVVKAVDTGEDGAGRTVTATVAADGRYEVPTDPGRVYRLFIEPPADRRVPRIPLEPFRARPSNVTMDRALPARLGLSGAALENGNPAAGVLIQVFCVGAAPTCIDPESPDITSTPPIDETISSADGRYQLWLPDPGQ